MIRVADIFLTSSSYVTQHWPLKPNNITETFLVLVIQVKNHGKAQQENYLDHSLRIAECNKLGSLPFGATTGHWLGKGLHLGS